MLTACRIVRPRYAEEAFSGDGARIHGGRWNSRGHSVVYASSNAALAALELLVHVNKQKRVRDYVLVQCWFPEAIVETLDPALLPEDWRTYPPPPRLAQIGNEWIASRASVVLAVPSAVVNTELNYLINPEHPDFNSVDIGEPRPFTLDRRLFT